MEAKDLRIVFLGTPEFAVASLKALTDEGFNIVGVVTSPDKPAGRGMKMQQSDVKKFALEKGFKILQPEKLRDKNFLNELQSLNADLQIVVAFRMLPEAVWNMPRFGTINLHGSLLPDYRGAAPINWAIINGEEETGVTTFQLQQKIDTGNILLQKTIPITSTDTAGTLHDKMKDIGAAALVETIYALAAGTLQPKPQPEPTEGKDAPKIFKADCEINFNKSAEEVNNFIRGLSPYPGAYTHFDGKMLKIFSTEIEKNQTTESPGTFIINDRQQLKFACQNGYIIVKEVQAEGKRRMNADDFLRGRRADA